MSDRLAPTTTPDTKFFWDALKDDKLLIQANDTTYPRMYGVDPYLSPPTLCFGVGGRANPGAAQGGDRK